MYIRACNKDKDAFQIYYNAYDAGRGEYYIRAKLLMTYIAKLIGVGETRASLSFAGVLLDEQTIMINLADYEMLNNRQELD